MPVLIVAALVLVLLGPRPRAWAATRLPLDEAAWSFSSASDRVVLRTFARTRHTEPVFLIWPAATVAPNRTKGRPEARRPLA